MGDSILKIKITIPPRGSRLIPRPRLLERLEQDLVIPEGFSRRLTLVAAPAGSGKTTLVREWLAGKEKLAAWYSLDESDSEPERFWGYLVSALQIASGGIGRGTLEMLRSSGIFYESAVAYETFLTPLLNDLLELGTPLYLVLDDFHLAADARIHDGLRYFIDNLPPSLHLVVITRSSPPWPLAGWLAKNRAAEIRQADLAFTGDEAKDLFALFAQKQLSKSQLNVLYAKTEGWITGLLLAAYSLSAGAGAAVFIDGFNGSHRRVDQFLTEEIVNKQSPPVREFLRQTAILDRFCAPLCNAVTGREDSRELIDQLEKNNLFVISLDERRTWYRYHSLFRELLLGSLKNHSPQIVPGLHQRAGRWFQEADEAADAVKHAFLGDDPERAALILHRCIEELWKMEGLEQLGRWLKKLPPPLLQEYPLLFAYRAFLHLVKDDRKEIGSYLQAAAGIKCKDPREQDEFDGVIAVIRAYQGIFSNDLSGVLEHAGEALRLLPQSRTSWRLGATLVYGDAKVISGDLEGAGAIFKSAYQESKQGENPFVTLISGIKAGFNLWNMGKLADAERLSGELLRYSEEEGITGLPRAGLIWSLLAELAREKGDLDEAERFVERALAITGPEKQVLAVSLLLQAITAFSRHDLHKALKALEHIEALDGKVALPVPITLSACSWKARLLLESGEPAKAREQLAKMGITEDAALSSGQENGCLVLSRVLLAENKLARVRRVLSRVEQFTADGQRRGLLLETLLLRCRLEEEAGNRRAAEEHLAKALAIGRESGYFQTFFDGGGDLAPVFARVHSSFGGDRDMKSYIGRIVCRLSVQKSRETRDGRRDAFRRGGSGQHGLMEELSPRESEILEMIGRGLSNRDIARKLYISEATVKWHTGNIYSKLGVASRTQALARALELGLAFREGKWS